MDTAAEWAAISPHGPNPGEDRWARGTSLVTNLSWSQQHQTLNAAAPLFGGRRGWLDYTYETTGYGSLELRGPLAYRVTIVQPGDAQTLRRHHRLVRSGHLKPARRWRRCDPCRVHVIERDELCRTRADDRDSWLFAAQGVARLCAGDDEVARLAGASLCRLLWFGREHLSSEHVSAAFAELRRATEALAAERRSYRTAVERRACAGEHHTFGTEARLQSVDQLAQEDLESIRLEVRALSEVQSEWGGASGADQLGWITAPASSSACGTSPR